MSERVGQRRPATSRLKRSLDAVVSATLLAAAAPIVGLGALAVLVEDGRPVFFRQQRVGLRGKRFEVLKLRTMRLNDVPPDTMGQVRSGHALLTRSGALLRRLKIDELPQLLNVLRGEMSLVGPRPTLAEQVERYGRFEARRLEVRPGLSGWAQIHGNTELTWQERIALDVWYIDHWSAWLDLRILAATAGVILFGERRSSRALERAHAHAHRRHRGG